MHEEARPGKHATASVFALSRSGGRWRLGLIEHPRYARLMIPGGHVEVTESPAETAIRETAEETGLAVVLLAPPQPPLPSGYLPPRVAQPWWIVEYDVPPDGHLATGHVHVDYLYLGLACPPGPQTAPAHPFGWYAAEDLAGLEMFPDMRILASAVLAAAEGEPGAELRPALAGLTGHGRHPGSRAPGSRAPGPLA